MTTTMTVAQTPMNALAAKINEQREASAEQMDRMSSAVQRLRQHSIDAVIPTPGLTAEVVDAFDGSTKHDRLRLVATDATGNKIPLRILEGAHEQLAQKLDIPRKFYDRLLTMHTDLLATNVSELFKREPDTRMLRMLKPTMTEEMERAAHHTGTQFAVRAIVSSRYRALDNGALLDVLLPEAEARGLRLAEWNLDDRRFALRFTGQERTIGQIREAHGFKADGDNYHRTENGVDLAWVNEVLSFGVAITNSETGHGSLAVRQFARVLRCLNAFVKDETHRTVHVGRKHEDTDSFVMQEDTKRLGAAAQFALVRDRFIDAVSESKERNMAEKFAAAMGQPLELPEALPVLTFIDSVGDRFELSDREKELLQEEVTHEMIVTQRVKPTAFSIAQGFTAAAQRLPEGGFHRKQEIETMGWQIIDNPTATLVKAAQDAVKRAAK